MREWQRVEYAANNYLAPEARDRVLELLDRGRVHGAVLSRDSAAAQTNYDGSVTLNRSDWAGRSTFEYAANNLAFVMAHESQHVEQFSGLGGIVNKVFYGLGIRRSAMEADAYAYACAYVKDKNSSYRPVCVGR